jgi:hypothetical protein
MMSTTAACIPRLRDTQVLRSTFQLGRRGDVVLKRALVSPNATWSALGTRLKPVAKRTRKLAALAIRFARRKKRLPVRSRLTPPSIRLPAGRTICRFPAGIRLRGARPSKPRRMVSLAGQRIDGVLLLPVPLRVTSRDACAPISSDGRSGRPDGTPRACLVRVSSGRGSRTYSVCKEG